MEIQKGHFSGIMRSSLLATFREGSILVEIFREGSILVETFREGSILVAFGHLG